MAEPVSTTVLVVKAAASKLAKLTDPEERKKVGRIICFALSPVLLLIMIVLFIGHSSARHNTAALNLTFHGGMIPLTMPLEYRMHIEDMRASFVILDATIAVENALMEGGDSLDSIRVKSIFYALYFGDSSFWNGDHITFVDCFVTTEERTRTVTRTNAYGGKYEVEETYTVTVPITDMSMVYANIQAGTGRSITHENRINASEIYSRIKYGQGLGNYGGDYLTWAGGLPLSDEPFVGIDGFTVPVGGSWQALVTSEFGPRSYAPDPNHTGIDFGVPTSSNIYAALDGTVQYVRHSYTGYGVHVAIDHGGGIVTMYAHCSEILVAEGQAVSAGDLIARSGNTGLSEGPHLHFEIRENGTPVNPRNYLPK